MDKAELKLLLLHDLGCDVEDMKESVGKDKHQHAGAAMALRQAAKQILALQALVDDDVDKGRYGVEESTRLKAYVARAASQCEDMSKAAVTARAVSEGREQGIAQVVQFLQKKQEAEKLKKLLREVPVDPKGNGASPVGRHPGPSISQQRKDESMTTKKPRKKRASKKTATKKRAPRNAKNT